MSKKIMTILWALILAVGLAVPQSFANHCGGKGDDLAMKFFMKAHMLIEHQADLGLTDQQVQEIRQTKIDFKKEWLRTNAEIEALKLDVKSALYAEKVDQAKIDKLIDQKYELKKGLAKNLVAALIKLKGIPDDKQWAAFKKLKEESRGGKGYCTRCSKGGKG